MRYQLYFTVNGIKLWLTAKNGFSANTEYVNAATFETVDVKKLETFCLSSLRGAFETNAPFLKQGPWKCSKFEDVTIHHERIQIAEADFLHFLTDVEKIAVA